MEGEFKKNQKFFQIHFPKNNFYHLASRKRKKENTFFCFIFKNKNQNNKYSVFISSL